jgi:hypothetical protein
MWKKVTFVVRKHNRKKSSPNSWEFENKNQSLCSHVVERIFLEKIL